MYRTILLPADGSDTTERAAVHAADLASQYDADLHVLYVVDESVFAGDVDTGPLVEAFEEIGESIVEDVSSTVVSAGVDAAVTAVVRGTPHEEILEYVDDNGVDLIVMGTHGRTGLDRYLLGSVTEKVVRLSDVPVLTVRQDVE